jgi:hypothetical protein
MEASLSCSFEQEGSKERPNGNNGSVGNKGVGIRSSLFDYGTHSRVLFALLVSREILRKLTTLQPASAEHEKGNYPSLTPTNFSYVLASLEE